MLHGEPSRQELQSRNEWGLTQSDPTRPYCTLTLTGGFSFEDMHTWLALALPDIPPKFVHVCVYLCVCVCVRVCIGELPREKGQ